MERRRYYEGGILPSEVTPVSEIAQYRFTPGAISLGLLEAYMAEVQPK